VKPGDYFVVRTKGPAAWLIRLVTRSQYNHAGIIAESDGTIIESEGQGAVRGQIDKYKTCRLLTSTTPLSDVQRALICTHAEELLGVGYGWADLLWLGLLQWPLLRRLGFLRRWVSKTDDLVCSQLVAYCYGQAGIVFNESCPQDVTPGDLARAITAPSPVVIENHSQ
jgi:hypothetical protein